MDKHCITELRSMAKPPEPVKDIIRAIMFLLGEELPNHQTEEWKKVGRVLGGVKENCVVQRWAGLDLSTIPPENIQQARDLLSKYSYDVIANSSRAAVVCYKACMDKLGQAPSTGENKAG